MGGEWSQLTSFTVSQGFDQGFTNLVKGCRMAEVKRRRSTPDAQRLLLLGISCGGGFNSKPPATAFSNP